MSVNAVETKRAAAGISKRRLCLAARIPTSTYYRLLAKRGSGRIQTVERLTEALDCLVEIDAQRRQAPMLEPPHA